MKYQRLLETEQMLYTIYCYITNAIIYMCVCVCVRVCVCVCVCVYTLYNGSNTSKTRMLNMKSNLYYGMGEIKLNCKTHTIV